MIKLLDYDWRSSGLAPLSQESLMGDFEPGILPQLNLIKGLCGEKTVQNRTTCISLNS